MSDEQLQERIAEYCGRYQAQRGPRGLPVFPSGRRETPQHREWLALYKLHSRLARRSRGQCERCAQPSRPGSVFCELHGAVPAGDTSQTPRAAVPGQLCLVCGQTVTSAHDDCERLVAQLRVCGPAGLERLKDYLWPTRGRRP